MDLGEKARLSRGAIPAGGFRRPMCRAPGESGGSPARIRRRIGRRVRIHGEVGDPSDLPQQTPMGGGRAAAGDSRRVRFPDNRGGCRIPLFPTAPALNVPDTRSGRCALLKLEIYTSKLDSAQSPNYIQNHIWLAAGPYIYSTRKYRVSYTSLLHTGKRADREFACDSRVTNCIGRSNDLKRRVDDAAAHLCCAHFSFSRYSFPPQWMQGPLSIGPAAYIEHFPCIASARRPPRRLM